MTELYAVLLNVVHVAIITLLLFGIKWLLAKSKIELNQYQSDLLNKVVEYAVLYVEQVSINKKAKEGIILTSTDKLQLAKETANIMLDKLGAQEMKEFVIPMIEGMVNKLFNHKATI